jgi:hypothetical protein
VKSLLILFVLIINSYATSVLVSKVNINYKSILDKDNLYVKDINKNIRCTSFDKNLLDNHSYQAKRYIIKGTPICYKDVQKTVINKVKFDFGNIEIQRTGKIIGENKDYIKIKDNDGKIIKIYKNGQN